MRAQSIEAAASNNAPSLSAAPTSFTLSTNSPTAVTAAPPEAREKPLRLPLRLAQFPNLGDERLRR